jgi:DNA polymerase-1
MQEKKLFLLDAFALIFRAYYALIRSPRITSTGKNTNAQFGFTNTLLELLNKEKPTHMAVVFDTAAATERHTDYEHYKANRQEAPEDLLAAVPDIKKLIRAFNIPVLEKDGYEADDVIGTLALEAADLGYTVYMVTPDKDYGQVVRDNVFIYKPSYQGNGAEIHGPKEVCERWGIKNVSQVIDMLALMGDAVDNIPGIPGVGEKTAAKLLAEYETVENVLANADKIKGAMGQKVMNGKESAIMSKKLATIITNAPVPFHEEDFSVKEWNKEALSEVFASLEFRTLAKRLLGEGGNAPTPEKKEAVPTDLFGNPLKQPTNYSSATTTVQEIVFEEKEETTAPVNLITIEQNPHEYFLVNDDEAVKQLVAQLSSPKEIAFDTETTNVDANLADLVGLSFCWEKGKAYYVNVPEERDAVIRLLEQFKPIFDREDITWVGQNIKYDLLMLKWYGFGLKGKLYDTMLVHYVVACFHRNIDW